MKSETANNFKTVDEYVSSLPQHKKNFILKIREAVTKAAPEAEEVISYNMPA